MANGHPLASRIDGPLPMEGNADDLHRLVVNLLDNAVRHTPPGAKVELEAKRSNGDLELSVSDEGPGLPDGKEDQVFERFVRGEGPADVAGHGGTGLGLAIVKAVADAHGGNVSAGRSPSGGALFTVKIPSAT
jgi:signal transduction histidine kinase